MKRHMASHGKETLKYSPVISKAKSERLNLKMPRLVKSRRAPQPRAAPTPISSNVRPIKDRWQRYYERSVRIAAYKKKMTEAEDTFEAQYSQEQSVRN